MIKLALATKIQAPLIKAGTSLVTRFQSQAKHASAIQVH